MAERLRTPIDRTLSPEKAEMQKLFVTGHLLPGADLSDQHMLDFIVGLGQVCDMKIFDGPHVKTPDSYDMETFRRLGNRPPEDINVSVMWDDSGAQMYVFPTKGNWFTLDIYTCKKFDEQAALAYVYEELDPREDIEFATQTHNTNTPWMPFALPNGEIVNPESRFTPQIDAFFTIDLSGPDELIVAGRELERAVLDATRKNHGKRLAASYTPEQIRYLQELHGNFEIAVDQRFMEQVIAGNTTTAGEYPFQARYNRLSWMETTAANLQRGKSVIHIGTGWPGTAIGLYDQFGIPVTCVEKDPETAEKSAAALDKLGLLGRDKLQVICADGTTINPEQYAAVIVSAMVPNADKVKIVENMRRLSTGGQTDPLLILRSPADRASALLYQELSSGIKSRKILIPVADSSAFVTSGDPLQSFVYHVEEMSSIRRGEDYRLLVTKRELQPV